MNIYQDQVSQARTALERYRTTLVKFAKLQHSPILEIDRKEIIKYLEHGGFPDRPDTIPLLMKCLIKSCYSYAVLRKYCVSILGEIPSPGTIGECLARVFSHEPFREEETWFPAKLGETAAEIQVREKYDLKSNRMKPRMIRVLLDSSSEMGMKLERGLSAFYLEVEDVVKGEPEHLWEYVVELARGIYNVGPALICDFLKEIGFSQFVKVDHHFQKEFPALMNMNSCDKISPRIHFIISQQISKELGMTPYHLDKILYDWGRYKKYANWVE